MGSTENLKSFLRQVRQDAFLRIFLVVFILLHLPYFLPDTRSQNIETYGLFVSVLFLLPVTVIALWPRRRDGFHSNERFFWKALSIAFAAWWLVNMMYLFWPEDSWSASIDVVTDSIFLVSYISWLVAASSRSHFQDDQNSSRSSRWMLTTVVSVLSFGLFFYFILIPSRLAPVVYDYWIPSLLFYTGIDCILAVSFVHMALAARKQRWRVLYGLLAVANIAFASLDLLEALDYRSVYSWASYAGSDTLWSLPFLLMLVIARARSFNYPESDTEIDRETGVKDILEANISPIIMMSFILPVLHVLLDQLGLLQDSMRKAQGTVVLFSLVIFWVLVIMENVYLRIATQKAKAQSAELEELRVKQEVAERAEKAKGRFLANVSHEIRTPMNGILGMSDILLCSDLNSDQRQHATLLQSSAKEMINVVDDILDYSKIEAGELSLVPKPFRLDQLARQVVDLFGATEKLENVEMNLVIQDDVPLEIEADASRLRQVLVNLVSNAVKFTAEGEITIRFSVLDRSESSARIHCEVSDSGIGIKTAEVDGLFQPFSQGDESTSRKFGGSGLGLAISRQIIEAHGGKIGASARPDGDSGAVFWFEIPLRLAQVSPAAPIQAVEKAPVSHSTKKILLAEDDRVNQFVTVKQLEELGHQVDIANNGHEALKALDQDSYALVLMDCQMPELDGLQATRLIREKGYSKSELPIIALTANVFDEDREACFECGMNDFITKPVIRENFLAVLAKWL